VLSARTEPPWSFIISWTNPVEPLEQVGHLPDRDARPGVADGQLHRTAGGPQTDRDLPLERELEGVRQEVQDDVLPHVPVHVDRLGKRGAVHDQPQAGLLARGAEVAGQVRRQGGQVGRLIRRLGAARLDAGEVQEGVDELEQAESVAVGRLQRRAMFGCQRLMGVGQGVLDRAEQEGQGGPELVADVRKEGGLGPVEFGARVGALSFFLISTGVGDGGADVPGQ
jgi:hypothetical protein